MYVNSEQITAYILPRDNNNNLQKKLIKKNQLTNNPREVS